MRVHYFPWSLCVVTAPVCLFCSSWKHFSARKHHLPDLLRPLVQPPGRGHQRGGRCLPPQTGSSHGNKPWWVFCTDLCGRLLLTRPLSAAQPAHCGRQHHRRVTKHTWRARACSQHPAETNLPPLSLLTPYTLHADVTQLPESSCWGFRGGCSESGELTQFREVLHSSL